MSIILNMDSVGDYNSFWGRKRCTPWSASLIFQGPAAAACPQGLRVLCRFSEGPEMRRPAVRKALL